jgi:hypothetical protein
MSKRPDPHLSSLCTLTLAAILLSCVGEPASPSMQRERDATTVHGQQRDAGSLDASAAASDGPWDGGLSSAGQGVPSAPDAATFARSSLIIHELWWMVMPTEDPFDDRPDTARCERSGLMAELLADESVFSVDTGLCNYVTVSQSTLRDVAAGDTIKVRLWHFALSAPEPAQAHAAVLVDGLRVLDERVAIPGPGGLLSRELRAERAIPSGAPVYFHLHNHGSNSWSLVEISTGE